MTTGRTLRQQLERASLLTTLLGLLLSASLFLVYEYARTRDEREEDLLAQADLLAQSVAPTLVFNDPATAALQLRSLQQKRGLRSADVYTARGALFAHFASDGSPASRLSLDAPRAWPESRFSGTELALEYPVLHDGERVGTIRLLAQHDIVGRIASYALFACVAVGVSLALARFLFGGLVRRLTSPLDAVASIAQKVMASQDWRLRAPSSDIPELGTLVDSFNGMLAEVQKATAALENEMAHRSRVEADLRQADRRKDEFIATLAHELRNPLAPMTNAVSILQLPNASDAMRAGAVQMMQRQLRHTVRLIDDLLDVSRIATGKMALQFDRVDLAPVLLAAIESIEAVASRHELSYRSAVQDAPCRVRGDGARLVQVFCNLLSNACKYTPRGGHIRVDLDREDACAVVTITDDGIGIDPSMQERIFEMFVQVDKSLERGNAGLGVGLSLARQLVHLHGGTLTVRSEGLGHGASFAVQLPLLPESIPLQAVVSPSDQSIPGRSLRILVADDNIDAAVTLQALMEMLGHQVDVVHDGHAAVGAARAHRPDVAVVDIGMPVMNGYDVAKQLRADPLTARMGLIALTGWGQETARHQAAAAGFDVHLVKPVDHAVLEDALLRVSERLATSGTD